MWASAIKYEYTITNRLKYWSGDVIGLGLVIFCNDPLLIVEGLLCLLICSAPLYQNPRFVFVTALGVNARTRYPFFCSIVNHLYLCLIRLTLLYTLIYCWIFVVTVDRYQKAIVCSSSNGAGEFFVRFLC